MLLCAVLAAGTVDLAVAQQKGVPRNDLPQPYRTTRDWGELPPGVKWAAVTAIEPAPDGTIFVVHRCFANSCAGRPEAPILKYDANGKLLATFGPGNVRLPARRHRRSRGQPLDHRCGRRRRQGPRRAEVQSRRQGAHDARQARASAARVPTLFDQPTDVVVAPNGDIFVTDSHRNGKNNRVVRFTRDGKFVKEWGRKGSGRGELSEPHTIAMDSRGRLFVGDRENNRIQIFDQDGTVLDEWRQFGRPSGIVITRDDMIYVADSESGGRDTGAHELPGIKKGIRIGSARDGSVTAFIEDSESLAVEHAGAEGIGVDAEGQCLWRRRAPPDAGAARQEVGLRPRRRLVGSGYRVPEDSLVHILRGSRPLGRASALSLNSARPHCGIPARRREPPSPAAAQRPTSRLREQPSPSAPSSYAIGLPGVTFGTSCSSRTTNVPPTMTWRMPSENCAGFS